MKLYSSAQMRALDEKATKQHKIPSLLLMEHAGHEAALAVLEILGCVRGKRLLVVCGIGNNGGDGLVSARILRDWGAIVSVFLIGDSSKLKGDPKTNFEILNSIDPSVFVNKTTFQERLSAADVLVDALFGTGLTRPIEGEPAAAIQAINASQKRVVAIDLPSGVDSDTGRVMGVAVKAIRTVTLAGSKVGLLLYPGRALAGHVSVAYISIPQPLLTASESVAEQVEAEQVRGWIPKWEPDIHKGERGRVLIIGGSRGLSGAPALAAMAATRGGAGLVYLAVPDGIRTLMEHKLTEPIKVGLPQTSQWVLGKTSFPETKTWFEKIDALAIGPGIGRAAETEEYVRQVILEYQGPLVIDADALHALDDAFLANNGRPAMILTPHEGEMGKLCGIPSEEVRQNRLALAVEKAKRWNVTLVLKGGSTIIASPATVWINPTGNPGMATGGSGDVLTGILVSLLGQKLPATEAAVAAVYLHGLSGDLLLKERGVRGITPERISEGLYQAFQWLSSSDIKLDRQFF